MTLRYKEMPKKLATEFGKKGYEGGLFLYTKYNE